MSLRPAGRPWGLQPGDVAASSREKLSKVSIESGCRGQSGRSEMQPFQSIIPFRCIQSSAKVQYIGFDLKTSFSPVRELAVGLKRAKVQNPTAAPLQINCWHQMPSLANAHTHTVTHTYTHAIHRHMKNKCTYPFIYSHHTCKDHHSVSLSKPRGFLFPKLQRINEGFTSWFLHSSKWGVACQ